MSSINDSPLFSLLRENMSWAARRQGLLAQNIANADTPGYASRDLNPVDFKSVLKNATGSVSTGLELTSSKHIQPVSFQNGGFSSFQERKAEDVTLSKNSVDLEAETIKMAKTKDHYTMVVNIYKKFNDFFRLALGRGGVQ